MAEFELDRLFGLALTDRRFFEQLRQEPQQAIGQFELTDAETDAVIQIAPTVQSIQELAVQLDRWMTVYATSTASTKHGEQVQAIEIPRRLLLLDVADPGDYQGKHDQSPTQNALQTRSWSREQGICLALSEYVAPS